MITRDTLYDLYEVKKLTISEIAKQLSIGYSTVRNWLVKYEIPRRTNGEVLTGRSKSLEHRQKFSDSKKGSKHPNFGKKCKSSGKRCWYTLPDGRIVSMRSQWEVWYAEYLKENGISYQYEPITYTLTNGQAYTPDFILDSGIVVEVKGWLTVAHKYKIDQFKTEHPDVPFILANRQYLESLGIDLRKKWIATKPQVTCDICNGNYYRSYPQQRYCSTICRNKAIARGHCEAMIVKTHKRKYEGIQTGSFNNSSKLSEEQVREIHVMRNNGRTLQEIASIVGSTIGNVSNILKGRSWKYIYDEVTNNE